MAYIDLNMVRAGVVDHPSEWPDCGYHEIQNPPQRYAIIDRQKLAELAMLKDLTSLNESHTGWIQEMLPSKSKGREDKWSTSIAVGGEEFVSKIKQFLGVKATGRRIVHSRGASELREPASFYINDFEPENAYLRAENMHYWHIYLDNRLIRSDPMQMHDMHGMPLPLTGFSLILFCNYPKNDTDRFNNYMGIRPISRQ